MMNKILAGLKRLIYGTTTVFTVYTGSTTLNGNSFVEIYKKTEKCGKCLL